MKKDEPIDRLLERASRTSVTPADACLDAETLAAWTDGALTADARAAAEAHAADCARCLQVLAAIARTTPPPSEATSPSWFSIRVLLPLATAGVAITAWVLVQDPATPTAPIPPQTTARVEPAPTTPPIDAIAPSRRQERPAAGAIAGRGTANEAAKRAIPQTTTAPAMSAPPAVAQDRGFMARADKPPTVVISPDPNVRWRFSGTTVERSVDGGETWRPEPIVTVMELLAGSSPDPNVCWLVGRKGDVWMTSDRGSWRRLEFPDMTVDLVAVSARDARAATVTTRTGSTYSTDDGGKTWRVQEN
jgi:hypothetical protein